MYKTCKYCGKVVDENHQCPNKREYRKKEESTRARRFRNSKAWMRKSIEIRERDRYLCCVCMSGKYDTIQTLNYKNLEVHHIIPIEADYDKRLDNDNLITLCQWHHKMAEAGKIPVEELQELVREK